MSFASIFFKIESRNGQYTRAVLKGASETIARGVITNAITVIIPR